MRISKLIESLKDIAEKYGDIDVKCAGREEPIDYYSNLAVNSVKVIDFYEHADPYVILSSDNK